MKKVITAEEFNKLFDEFKAIAESFHALKESVSDSIDDFQSKIDGFGYSLALTRYLFNSEKDNVDILANSSIKFDNFTCEYSWERNLPINTTKASYYGKFVKDVLELFSPLVIRIPANMLPVVAFSDLFVPTGKTPLEGNYICGEVKGVPVIMDNNLSNTVEIENTSGETGHIKIHTNGN